MFKKLLLITILFCGFAYAQNSITYWDTVNLKWVTVSNGATTNSKGNMYGVLPVDASATDLTVRFYGASDSLNADTPDTLSRRWMPDSSSFSRTFTKWWEGNIEVSDTAEMSTSASFASGTVWKLLPYRLYPLSKFSIGSVTNLFIRRFVTSGATGVIYWDVRFWGF